MFIPSSDIHLKLDSCAADIMKGCLSDVGLNDFDGNAENARLYITLDRVCSVNIQCLYLQILQFVANHQNVQQNSKVSQQEEQNVLHNMPLNRQEFIWRKQLLYNNDLAISQHDLQVIGARLKAYSEVELGEFHCIVDSEVS